MSPDDRLAIFRAWAPASGRWSAWAKPVLFTYEPRANDVDAPVAPLSLDAVPPGDAGVGGGVGVGVGVVVDLPGVESVACGLELAGRGYQPVPLFNVTCGPGRNLVDASALVGALRRGATALAACTIRPDAPPAFMIDSNRLRGLPMPDTYDNRWLVFPQDLPSARVLRDGGIARILVIRRKERLFHDLRAVLRNWRKDGLEVTALDPGPGTSSQLEYSLSMFAGLADHLRLVFHGLSVNSAGGFGGFIPDTRASPGVFG